MTELALVSVEATLDAFAAAVREAMDRGGGNLAVSPDDDFAKKIRARFPDVPSVAPEQAEILCLTHRERQPLELALHAQIDRRSGAVIIPRVQNHGLDRPLFLISIPKAGTHLLYRFAEELGFKPGVICPENPARSHWYCIEYSNSHTVPRDFFVDSVRRSPFGNRLHPFPSTPALFIVRHPWDILVSEANYYPKPGNTVFSGFYDGLDFDARITRLLEDDRLLGRFGDRILAFEPWLSFNNVIPLAFEDLVGAPGGGDADRQTRLIWAVQIKLGVPGVTRQIAGRLFDRASPTFNEGMIGSHRQALSRERKDHLDLAYKHVLQAFGYQTGDDPYTANSEQWRRRPLPYLEKQIVSSPVLQEDNYLGYNLVRYLDRFYAVPIALGAVNIANDEQLLKSLLSADSLPALRTMVINARNSEASVRAQLDLTAALLDERTRRLAALEADTQERNARLFAVEQELQKRKRKGIWRRVRSAFKRLGRGRQRER